MKRISFICLLILLCSLPGRAQFWISFGWNEPHCQSCLWMEQAMRLNGRQAADYHNIVHKYGQKIEKEARKHYRYWDQSAKKIFNLRMERDRKLQRVLSPSQFRLYVRFVRERPQRIHDYQGWYNNPHYPEYRPSNACRHYEDQYWRSDRNQHYDRPSRPKNDRYNKDRNSDNRKERDKDRKEKDKKDNRRQESKRSEVYRRS